MGIPPKHSQFKKGVSGNPKGRPKLPDLSELMGKTLGKVDRDGLTAAERILKKLERMAAAGNLKAAEILLDRGYGKPKQSHDHTGSLVTSPPVINVTVKPLKAVDE